MNAHQLLDTSRFLATNNDSQFLEKFNNLSPSRIFKFTLDTCLEMVEKTTISEPHFRWEDLSSVIISPSDYQFTQFQDADYELVSIEEDDIPLRDFCSQALDSIDLYRTLEDGWDDDGAPAPSHSSLDDAEIMLRLVSTEVDQCPDIVAMLDFEGIPSLAFDSAKKYISIAFYGDDSAVTYTLNRKTNQSCSDSFNLYEREHLKSFITSISNL